MEYGILGPLEVVRDGTPVHVGPLKQRALLILLLVHANRVMPIDRLINELWAGRPPAQATITLQSYVSSLRRTLEPGRPAGAASTLLVWRSPGYLLRVEPDELDTIRFEHLVQEGRAALGSDPTRAEALLTQALRLWRGDALTDVATEGFALGEIARLTELHLSATEDRIEAGLALGRHGELAAVLEPLVAANPLRERVRGQLMLALYRCGRQADALRSYREAAPRWSRILGSSRVPHSGGSKRRSCCSRRRWTGAQGLPRPSRRLRLPPARARAHGALSGARPRRRASRPGHAKRTRGS